MAVFVISGASYGLGPELVRQVSSDRRNTVFALVKSAKAAERLANLSSARNNIHIYFETQGDRQADYEVIARDIGKTVSCVDVLLNNAAWVDDCLGVQGLLRSDCQANQINDLQQFFSNHVLDSIQITNAFLPLLHRGSAKKVVTITSDEAFNHRSLLPSGLDIGVAYAMAKTALDIVVSRYSAIPELAQNGFIYAMLECGTLDASEREKGNSFEQTQSLAREILEAMERLGCEDSGRCVKLRERDLITL